MLRLIVVLSYLFNLSASAEYLLYSPERKNVEPVSYYFNGAFDVIQNPYYFSQENFWKKHKELFRRIGSPNHSIKKDGGYGKFFKDEFLTTRVVPNIGLHLIGGGYDTRLLQEYFKDKGATFPLLYAVTVSYLAHFGNEALELTNSNITSHDHIADLFIFDVAAVVLFQNDNVVKFFRDDLGMRHWHMQPMVESKKFDITNAGLNYIFRPDVFKSKVRPFLYLGMQTLTGGSYEFREKEFFSFAAGMALTDPLLQKGRFVTGLFYDKEDDLNWSVFMNGSEDYKIRMNLYPAFLRSRIGEFGLLIGARKGAEQVIGINYKLPLGLSYIF